MTLSDATYETPEGFEMLVAAYEARNYCANIPDSDATRRTRIITEEGD